MHTQGSDKKETPRPENPKFVPSWDLYALGLLALYIVLQYLRWRMFPLFLDVYYHLSVMHGFDMAGGYVTHSFWQAAPSGIPHLYPPLLHIIMLTGYKLGLSDIVIARLLHFLFYPLALFVFWYCIKKLFNARLAFFVLLFLSVPFSLYLSFINTTASTLAMLFGMFSFLCAEKGKRIASLLLLACAFYSHALLSWIFLFTFILYAVLVRERRRTYFLVSIAALLCALPILIHEYTQRAFFSFVYLKENKEVGIHILIIALAIGGIVRCAKLKGRYYFFIALAISFFVFLSQLTYRYVSGEGMVACALLAGVAFEYLYALSLKRHAHSFAIATAIAILIFSPTVRFSKGKPVFLLSQSTLINLMPQWKSHHGPLELSIWHPRFYREIASLVKGHSREDDIVYSNFDYFSGALAILTQRVTSNIMLREVKPVIRLDAVKAAKIIVWLKDASDAPGQPYSLINKYDLRKVGETELVYIYENPDPHGKRHIAKPSITLVVIGWIIALVALFIVFDIRKAPR
ncbi:MAG: hypothetical protein C4540_03275 [Candidatus Omnitrophota bacterium]|jgi:hypothetical protein|nr:MAG: hypothetical protein C4540_03275 [Candidatus Omnitrophota bacterium]